MTMIVEQLHQCSVCGAQQKVPVMLSRFSFGGFTLLDMRSMDADRGMLHLALQQCQGCGYVAPDLRQRPAQGAAAALRQGRHRPMLADDTQPELLRRFLVEAMLQEADGETAAAGIALWRAAWVSDDDADALQQDRRYPDQQRQSGADGSTNWLIAQQPVTDPSTPGLSAEQVQCVQRWQAACERSRGIRGQAAQRFQSALAAGNPPLDAQHESELVLVDLLRRSGDYAVARGRALDLLSQGSVDEWDSTAGDALRLQVQLAGLGSDRSATMDEAEAANPDADAARQRRKARAERKAAEAKQAEADYLAWCIPANLGPPLAAAFERARSDGDGRALMDANWLQGLPIPSGVSQEIASLGSRAGWPAAATLAALGLAMQQVMPSLKLTTDDRAWRQAVQGYAAIVDHLAYLCRRCQPGLWHYWPPAGPGDGPPLPDYRD